MSAPPAAPDSETVLVLAPFGRDAILTCDILRDARIEAVACASMDEVCDRLDSAGAAIITTEALLDGGARTRLVDTIAKQPAWSDFPILVFAAPGARGGYQDVRFLGNATLLERPVAVRALVSAAENALRARRRQYQGRRAIRDRDQFLAMLGHELRNPLAAISLAVGGLARTEDPARIKKHVGVIQRQSENLAHLVDDLLDVARVTSGRIELKKTALDLNEIVARAGVTFEPQAVKGGLALAVRTSKEPVFVDGDAVRVEQIVTNLLGNALKYTPAGGRVDVVVDAAEHFASVAVKDTGVGIPLDVLPHVFDLFVQAPTTVDRSRGGLGIGLTVVKSLAALHGGTVEAHSAGPGSGAEFVLRLPRCAPAVALAAKPVVHEGRRRVLVVDDSDDVREALRDTLEALGHDVVTAADGSGGLARLLELVPSVAIIDIGLPGIDGYEIAREARRVLGQRVRLVALTGYGQPEDKERARLAGFDKHFTKPVDVHTLEEMI